VTAKAKHKVNYKQMHGRFI